jgi:hypothetical protein
VPDDEITADTTGDPRTADPCGMFDPDALREFGTPSIDGDDGNFNECLLLIRRPNNDEDDLDVMQVQATLALPGSEQIIRPEPGLIPFPEETPELNGECERYATLPDGNVFTIGVTHWSGWSAPLCTVASRAMLSALEVLNSGQIPRRPVAEKSLARVNVCGLVHAPEVEAALGGAADPDPYFAGWTCEWVHGPKQLFIAYDREDWPLTAEESEQEQAITIGSRRALMEAGTSGHPEACQVEIEHLRFGADTVETVEIYVEEEGTEATAHCATSQAIAHVVEQRLPD